MTITLESTKNNLPTLLVAVSCVFLLAAWRVKPSYCSPISKINEGKVVVREDSIITVVIPDKR